ncbi:hypothetical protein PC9H_009267 [Pleurotus ostreatus]|uniref:Uncharacterized protein n=1 Tax=Pleurotus ostreatus TaxID=5322 RepID=A0A8H6ZPD8_PLEOS|nr:uncharacterized protein PC9H_009267 [Pleurotus ostreatus]KAF7423967.1 hypothetical protein PC9H_009267 [Pleurotus ostreatus]
MVALLYHCLAFPLCFLIIFPFLVDNGANAGTLPPGAPCSPAHDHLDLISHKFVSQCSDLTFCRTSNNDTVGDLNVTLSGGEGGNGTCIPRLCRRDEFPFGYDREEDIYGVDVQPDLPPMCAQDMYCPDEGSGCKSVLTPGQKCQMGRDEQCDQRYSSASLSEPNDPVNSTIDLAVRSRDVDGGAVGSSSSGFGREKVFQIPPKLHANELGADGLKNETGGENQTVRVLCLLQTCTVARIGADEPCIFENTTYASYDAQGVLVEYNIYRDNCLSEGGLFCGLESKRCERKKELGWACATDVECVSFNCMQGICTRSPETPYVVAPWQYALTILSIVGATASTFTILMLLHKRHRARRYREIGEYYAEQLRWVSFLVSLFPRVESLPIVPGVEWSVATPEDTH